MVLSLLQKTERKISKAEEKLKLLRKERDFLLSQTSVLCTNSVYGKGCGKETEIRDLVYIQTHWYVPPSGCTGGDYWNEGEGQFACPHCGRLNRLYDRPKIQELKYLFKSVEDFYDK